MRRSRFVLSCRMQLYSVKVIFYCLLLAISHVSVSDSVSKLAQTILKTKISLVNSTVCISESRTPPLRMLVEKSTAYPCISSNHWRLKLSFDEDPTSTETYCVSELTAPHYKNGIDYGENCAQYGWKHKFTFKANSWPKKNNVALCQGRRNKPIFAYMIFVGETCDLNGWEHASSIWVPNILESDRERSEPERILAPSAHRQPMPTVTPDIVGTYPIAKFGTKPERHKNFVTEAEKIITGLSEAVQLMPTVSCRSDEIERRFHEITGCYYMSE